MRLSQIRIKCQDIGKYCIFLEELFDAEILPEQTHVLKCEGLGINFHLSEEKSKKVRDNKLELNILLEKEEVDQMKQRVEFLQYRYELSISSKKVENRFLVTDPEGITWNFYSK